MKEPWRTESRLSTTCAFAPIATVDHDARRPRAKRLVPSRLHELHESKFPFVSRIEFISSKLSIFLLMYLGSIVPVRTRAGSARIGPARRLRSAGTDTVGGGAGPAGAMTSDLRPLSAAEVNRNGVHCLGPAGRANHVIWCWTETCSTARGDCSCIPFDYCKKYDVINWCRAEYSVCVHTFYVYVCTNYK